MRLLTTLSGRYDRQKPGSRTPSIRVDFGDATSTEVHIAERLLIEAERLHAVGVERPKQTPHILHRIRLKDPAALSAFLGRELAANKANAALDRIAPLLEGAAIWVQDELEEAFTKWNRGERAFRIDADQIEKIEDLTKLLLAIDHGVDGRDLRTFSNAAGVDSKAFERHKGTIVQIARRVFGWGPAPEEEVLSLLGFKPFFQLVQIAGPIAIPAMRLDASEVSPFIGIPPLAVHGIDLMREIEVILTIENLTSFNRHTREAMQPNAVVLYSGGFPARPVVDTLCRLLEQAPNASVHHWGDIDAGGVRIFRNIEERISRMIRPHLMDRQIAEQHGHEASPVKALTRIAEQNTGIRDLALYLAAEGAKQLEQENVSPCVVR
ncbi:DUF2220 family protein [Sphingomonas sp. QA11]|uniref:Wadjet anti-phage system protein JetD domain-containing protein n=1 Tax=Sphingomonas sp. QA11 TaxID=2950605 RepID=UPI00234BB712|nr:Wadjet anti-phage system protein JetD domain-containing protein [Sphingomonas sp. QA11]WCM26331.1 DUF2220 family protein [Sphingomonas sp. QA11]